MTSPGSNGTLAALTREASRIEEDCTYSSKGHYNAEKSWSHVHLWIGIPTAVLAAIAAGSAFGDKGVVAGCISIVVAALTALATFLNPSNKSNAHRTAANHYLSLRNETRFFRETELGESKIDSEALKKEMKGFSSRRNELNESSPCIPPRAYRKAKQGIKAGESTHTVDKKEKDKESHDRSDPS